MFRSFSVKIFLIFLTLLSACSNSPKIEETEASNQQERLRGTLILWFSHPGNWSDSLVIQYEETVRVQIKDFTTLYPNVKIVVEVIPSEIITDLFVDQVSKGFGPNIIATHSKNIPLLIKAGAIQELSKYLSAEELSYFRPEALSKVRHQDKFYGFPIHLSTQVLCYNKAKVKEPPTSLSEVLAQARAGYSVGIFSGFDDAFWGTQIFGGQIFDSQNRVILDQGGGWSRWMEWLKMAQNQPNIILSDNEPALQQAFIEGKLSYLVCWSDWIPSFRQALGKNNLGATLLPSQYNLPAAPLINAQVVMFNRVSNANQTKLALKLTQFLTNVAKQKQMATKLQLAIPTNKDVQLNRGLFPLQEVLIEQSKTGFVIPLNQAAKMNALVNYGDILYQQVLAGEITPTEAATKLSRTINAKFESQ